MTSCTRGAGPAAAKVLIRGAPTRVFAPGIENKTLIDIAIGSVFFAETYGH
jgi:hypothetical protein